MEPYQLIKNLKTNNNILIDYSIKIFLENNIEICENEAYEILINLFKNHTILENYKHIGNFLNKYYVIFITSPELLIRFIIDYIFPFPFLEIYLEMFLCIFNPIFNYSKIIGTIKTKIGEINKYNIIQSNEFLNYENENILIHEFLLNNFQHESIYSYFEILLFFDKTIVFAYWRYLLYFYNDYNMIKIFLNNIHLKIRGFSGYHLFAKEKCNFSKEKIINKWKLLSEEKKNEYKKKSCLYDIIAIKKNLKIISDKNYNCKIMNEKINIIKNFVNNPFIYSKNRYYVSNSEIKLNIFIPENFFI